MSNYLKFMNNTSKPVLERCVLQIWVQRLSFMQQSVLLSAVRGPDGIGKYHKCKMLIRWYRRCVLISAFDGIVIDNPFDPRGGSFTGPSIDIQLFNWEMGMQSVANDFMNSRDELPFHYFLHMAHAIQVLGYKHPDHRIRVWWNSLYLRICKALHMRPESEKDMDIRLGDSELDWQDCADESATCSD